MGLDPISLGVTAGAGLVGQIYSQWQKTKAQNNYENYLNSSMLRRQNDLDATYNKRINQDYFDTAASKAAINKFQKYAKAMSENTAGAGIAGGATPEAMVAANGSLSDSYGNLLNNISAQATQYKQSAEAARDAAQNNLDNVKDSAQMALLKSKVDSFDNLGKNFASTTNGLLDAFAGGAFGK